MNELQKIFETIPQENLGKLALLSQLREVSPAKIMNDAVITYFGKTLKPRLKDYQTVYLEKGKKISAVSVRLEEKGKNPWKDGTHGMPNHLIAIFKTFGDDEVNNNLLEYSYRLMDITLKNIFENGSNEKVKKYRDALNKPNFAYMMLQISVRLLAFDLKERKIKLENNIMDYMSELFLRDKKNIQNIFESAYTDEQREVAITKYYSILDNHLKEFMSRDVNMGIALGMASELALLKDVGEETLFTFIGFLIEKVRRKFEIQMALFSQEQITIK